MKQRPTKAQLAQGQSHVQPVLQSGVQFLGGSDDCATPDLINTNGAFAVDTTVATDSLAPASIPCAGGVSHNDVWFAYTAPGSGLTTLSMCGSTGADTVLTVWAAGAPACPAPATTIACNDDSCGLQSQTSFTAVAGSTYMIQVGAFGAGVGYVGTLTIAQPIAPPNDSCATPAIAVSGSNAVDTVAATTGVEGQTEASCLFFSSTVIDQDAWFTWTSVTGGVAIVSLCGGVTADSKVAVYGGSGCPTAGTAIACNDDSCGLTSEVSFLSVAGSTYTIQTGSFPGAVGYAGTFTITEFPALPNDGCSTPTVLGPGGPYLFDTTVATTGTEGQAEALCLFFSSTTIDSDAWFTWTAPTTDLYRAFTCSQTAVDTKISVYAGAGCPTAGTSIACNDDDCALQSGAVFAATAGSSYTIQLGSFPGGAGGAGSFDVQVFVPTPGDDCATPVALAGAGPYAFDNSQATTGTQGQAEPSCLFFSSTTIDRDLWYCWTAPSTGNFEVSTVAQTLVDTKLAVYDGCGCPVSAALGCNDDACGTLQTSVTFAATAGNTYTIQLGTFPNAQGGAGTFTIAPPVGLPTGCAIDDGTTENSIGLTAGGKVLWMQRFGAIGDVTTVTDVSTAYGSAGFPGFAPANGTPTDILVWDDTDDDGDPTTGLVLVAQMASTVQNVDTDILNSTPIVPAAVVNGVFFVGAAVAHVANEFPAPLDQSTTICGGGDLSWIAGDTGGVLDYTNLNIANVPPASLNAIGFGGLWLLRGACSLEPGLSYCAGDGTLLTPCPCANFGAPGNGCRSSFNVNGAHMTAHGVVALDSVVLDGSGMNATGNCIFLKGNLDDPNGLVFGDGVRCATGTLIRLRTVPLVGGSASFPDSTQTITLSARGGTPVGSGLTGYYTVYYRNAAAAFCPPETFNSANGYQIVW
ncbi:MAG: hypothetical protein IPJ77_02825 [Planctomycetes bacterium]|nr:hypothetical protein [Planctomycetota bacterium]